VSQIRCKIGKNLEKLSKIAQILSHKSKDYPTNKYISQNFHLQPSAAHLSVSVTIDQLLKMVSIKTRSNGGSVSKKLLQNTKTIFPLIIGVFIGLSVGSIFHFLNTEDVIVVVPPSNTNESKTNQVNNPSTARSDDFSVKNQSTKGWHPIYVYYGKSEAIESDSAPLHLEANQIKGSQVRQDIIITALVAKLGESLGSSHFHNPYFVDLAANDAIKLSNTYNLEKKGWDGLCVEPNPVYWFRLAHRRCTVAGAFAGGKRDLQQVEVLLKTKELGGIVGDKFDNKEGMENTEKRFTISIQSLFKQFDVPKVVDYLSLDVEGAEELVMRDFPFDSYTIRFVTIERPKLDLQNLMKERNYHFVALLVHWGETLWVHGSVLEKMGMETIKKIVDDKKVSGRRFPSFDMKTGKLVDRKGDSVL
jgi:hypothetical protein